MAMNRPYKKLPYKVVPIDNHPSGIANDLLRFFFYISQKHGGYSWEAINDAPEVLEIGAELRDKPGQVGNLGEIIFYDEQKYFFLLLKLARK